MVRQQAEVIESLELEAEYELGLKLYPDSDPLFAKGIRAAKAAECYPSVLFCDSDGDELLWPADELIRFRDSVRTVQSEFDLLCPDCLRCERLAVIVESTACLTVEGIENHECSEWRGASDLMCRACTWGGRVSDASELLKEYREKIEKRTKEQAERILTKFRDIYADESVDWEDLDEIYRETVELGGARLRKETIDGQG